LIRDLPPLSHGGRVIPGVMSRSTEAAEGDTRDEVSLSVEYIVTRIPRMTFNFAVPMC
jgi:hypothetical protein